MVIFGVCTSIVQCHKRLKSFSVNTGSGEFLIPSKFRRWSKTQLLFRVYIGIVFKHKVVKLLT